MLMINIASFRLTRGFVRLTRGFALAPLILPILLLTITACATSRHAESARAFDQAQRAYDAGDYAAASDRFEDLIRADKGDVPDGLLAQAYRYRGECRMRDRQFTHARLDFEDACRIAAESDDGYCDEERLILECRIAIGDTYLHEKSYHVADRAFAEILALDPPLKLRDSLHFRRYICAIKLRRPDADYHLQRIESLANFDAPTLRREFLRGSPPVAVSTADPAPPVPRRGIAGLGIIPRSAWGAATARSNIDPMTPVRLITVHHTANIWKESDYTATARMIRNYQRMHQDPPRNWADIGYHFLIDYEGRIWEGRNLRYQGAHAGNFQLNQGNIGITVLGNFEIQSPNGRQRKALVDLISALSAEYRLSPDDIVTHLELSQTACPGRTLQRFIEELRLSAGP